MGIAALSTREEEAWFENSEAEAGDRDVSVHEAGQASDAKGEGRAATGYPWLLDAKNLHRVVSARFNRRFRWAREVVSGV